MARTANPDKPKLVPLYASVDPELAEKVNDIVIAKRLKRSQEVVVKAIEEYVAKTWTEELSKFARTSFDA